MTGAQQCLGGRDLVLTDVSVGYPAPGFRAPARAVLSGLSLRATAGRTTVLLGANGSGKSTLLRSLTGLQPLLGGRVRVGGDDLLELSPRERAVRLAVVLTDRFEPGLLRGGDVVRLGRYPHRRGTGGSTALDRAAVAGALAAVGADDLVDVPLARMSDGQRQRVLVARALAQEPAVLVLDEPTAFLDAPARLELLDLLGRIAAERDIPVVLSSHDVELAVRAGGDAWLIGPGTAVTSGPLARLVGDGSVAAAFETPSVVFDPAAGQFRLR